MDRMTPLDAAFWTLENEHASLHIAAVSVFEGPMPSYAEVAGRYTNRIATMPRYRQRMRTVPFGLGWPVWVDAPDFDLEYHLRSTGLPRPGGAVELETLIGRLMSTPLDRNRPLWEAWLVDGLSDERWALVTKVHHSLADGLAGMDLFTHVLDPMPGAGPQHPLGRPAPPQRPPGRPRLLAGAVAAGLASGRQAARDVVAAGRHPATAVRAAGAGVRGSLGYARALRPFSSSSLAGPIGGSRRYRTAVVDRDDIAIVRRAFGGSLNDVALAIVTHGFRELLLSRGEEPGAHTVRTLVPVSVRAPHEEHDLANKVSAILLDLPVDFGDPVAAHGAVVARMRELKQHHEADAGVLATELAGLLPAGAVAPALRAAFAVPQRVLTTVVTNVPGPPRPVHLLGRRMLALYPYVPIADRIRVGVALTSYDDRLFFGITCDRESVPDGDVLSAGIEAGLAALVKAADTTEGSPS
ncbi:MAG TPA: wax ester/triacylglycerol synthase family O-acyltransferase [Jatrophihabitans sp.]|jgi:diacylglycerol O-acyltransferase|uniref:WS/DGAT/MGAT family O-acyltransferase n=1 Tax=Jatrophihabitans sp. TaxID=1932789 RepID=UPI002E00BEED|nr:wax ester/triacylglycerol synthase family O-acyltransferase [Jatrophihabitans sp.]